MGLETSNKVPKMSPEMDGMPWKQCWPYCAIFLDLEMSYAMVGNVSKAFCTHLGILGIETWLD